MSAIIVCLVLATIAIASLILAPQIAEPRVIYSAAPDQPCGFGTDMSWLAIRTEDMNAVIEALGVLEAVPANWNSGIGTVYSIDWGINRVFVTTPVNGWTFVVGSALPYPQGHGFSDTCTPLLLALGARFKEVQYFASFPDIDLYAWARFTSGKLVRAFGIGDEGVIWNVGRTSREERTLGLRLFELRGVRGRRGDAGGELLMHPTQEHVMRLAGYWSLNPTFLTGAGGASGIGAICLAPSAWRAQRLRKTA